jgi:hypothetical protein
MRHLFFVKGSSDESEYQRHHNMPVQIMGAVDFQSRYPNPPLADERPD